jgi:hypothetical protein
MKVLILALLFVSSSAVALVELPSNVIPAEVKSVSTNNMFPSASLTITYLLPCGRKEVGILNQLDRKSDRRIVAVLINERQIGSISCQALPQEKVISLRVSNNRGGDLDKVLVLGQN